MPLSENIKQARNECGEGCVTARGRWLARLSPRLVSAVSNTLNQSKASLRLYGSLRIPDFSDFLIKAFCVAVPDAPRDLEFVIHLGHVYVHRV